LYTDELLGRQISDESIVGLRLNLQFLSIKLANFSYEIIIAGLSPLSPPYGWGKITGILPLISLTILALPFFI
jgi:hypothetical protein